MVTLTFPSLAVLFMSKNFSPASPWLRMLKSPNRRLTSNMVSPLVDFVETRTALPLGLTSLTIRIPSPSMWNTQLQLFLL